MYCFCEEHVKTEGHKVDKIYKLPYTDPSSWDINNVSYDEAPICKEYYKWMTGFGYILETTFSYVIVIASYVFRSVFIAIAEKLKFFSLTSETKFVMVAVFYITYINYGLINLFASIDMRESKIPLINNIFNGLYPDYNALWFNDIGVLIFAIMFSNMYWPPLEFIIYYGMRLGFRMLDQRTLFPIN